MWRGGKMTDLLKTQTAMDAEIGSPKSEPRSGNSGCLAQELVGGYAVILPTPNAVEAEKYTKTYNPDSQMGRSLTAMAVNDLLPTPLAVSVRHSKRCQELRAAGDVPFHSRVNGETRPNGLEDYLEFNGLIPSPTAMDSSEATARMRSSQVKEGSMHSVTLARAVQSQDSKDGRTSHLNPLFVGEMIGFPLTWLISPFLSRNGERRP